MAKKVKKEEVKEVKKEAVKEKTLKTAVFNLGDIAVKVIVNVEDKTVTAEVMEV